MDKCFINSEVNNKREDEIDFLRVLALLAVIMVHCTGINKTELINIDIYTKIVIFVTSIVTWQVPIFVMISGRFFLDPERNVSMQKITKAIKRLIIAFAVWNIIYQIYYIFFTNIYEGLNWKGILCQSLIGPYHFWFLFMMIFVYAISPFLRKITTDKKLMEYFILLFVFFELLTSYGVNFPFIGSVLAEILNKINFHFALGYSGYYILGYYLYKYKPSLKAELVLYICGICLLIIAGMATVYRVEIEGYNGEWYTKYLYPNIIIEAAAVYVFFVKRVGKCQFPKQIRRFIRKLSEYSFGVYLIHALVNEAVSYIKIDICSNPVIRLPIVLLIIYVVSNILVLLIRKIPFIGRKVT